jgi:hypothetical protein
VKLIRNLMLVSVLFASGAFANMLINGSFELGSFNNNSAGPSFGQALAVGSASLNGWSIIGNGNNAVSLAWLQTGDFNLTSENGSLFFDLTGYNDATPFGGVSQTVNLAVGNYTLSFWLGYSGAGSTGGPVSVKATVGNQPGVVFTSGSSANLNVWTQETLSFSIATAGNVAISLVGNSVPTGNQYIGFDNVDLEQAGVPEPAMSIPLALAGALFVLSRRKRARQ